jgi:hypothetical protein
MSKRIPIVLSERRSRGQGPVGPVQTFDATLPGIDLARRFPPHPYLAAQRTVDGLEQGSRHWGYHTEDS